MGKFSLKKSYFRKLLFNFFLTLCIPVITILLLYMHAESTVKKQILISGENALNQFYAAVNTVAEEMEDLCLVLIEDNACKQYAIGRNEVHVGKRAGQAMEVANSLNVFLQERYFDIFVYYPYEDRVISGKKSPGDAWHYYNSYYSNKDEFNAKSDGWYEFQELLKKGTASSEKPTFTTLQKDGRTYLCAIMQQYEYKSEKYNYMICVVLNPDYLESIIGINQFDLNVKVTIFDKKGKMLLSNESELVEFELTAEELRKSNFTKDINGKEHIIYCKKSGNIDGYYAVAISTEYLQRQMRTLHTTVFVSIIISIISSILVAFGASIRSWKPINKTLDNLKKHGENYDIGASDEFEYIELLFQHERDTKKQMLSKIRAGESVKREKAIMALLTGSIDKQDVKKVIKDNNIIFSHEGFWVCIINAEEQSGIDNNILQFVVGNVMEELCGRIGIGYVIVFAEKKYVLLGNCPLDTKEEDILELLQEGKNFIEEHSRTILFMGISQIHKNEENIRYAYNEAEKALAYKYIMSGKKIIQYTEISGREFEYDSFGKYNLSVLLMEFVHSRKREQDAMEFVAGLLQVYEIGKDISLETMECFRFEVLNAVHKVMTSCKYTQNHKKEKMKDLILAQNMDEFVVCLERLLEEVLVNIDKSLQQDDICIKAKNYIEQYYDDTQLSLEMLGQMIECSPPYLSRKFKEKNGISVLNYIIEVRIRNAKKLLQETQYSVQEISEMCGFLSSSTFVKTFKKKEGVAPGAYRLMTNEQNMI